jgi:hypothetical protein
MLKAYKRVKESVCVEMTERGIEAILICCRNHSLMCLRMCVVVCECVGVCDCAFTYLSMNICLPENNLDLAAEKMARTFMWLFLIENIRVFLVGNVGLKYFCHKINNLRNTRCTKESFFLIFQICFLIQFFFSMSVIFNFISPNIIKLD